MITSWKVRNRTALAVLGLIIDFFGAKSNQGQLQSSANSAISDSISENQRKSMGALLPIHLFAVSDIHAKELYSHFHFPYTLEAL